MKGLLYKNKVNEWFVNYNGERLLLHPESKLDFYNDGSEVDFIIVDEFTHPNLFKDVAWGDTERSALLTESFKNENFLVHLNELSIKNTNDMDFGRIVRRLLTNM